MQRFFCKQEEVLNHIVINDKDEIHHMRDVCRLKIKDKLELIDGKGALYRGHIGDIKKDKISINIETKQIYSQDNKLKITLACAIPKKAKMDYTIEKVTELGADVIIPLKTKRTIVNINKSKEDKILARWQKIAIEASKQSKRIFVPEIEKIKTLKEVFDRGDFDIKLLPTLEGEREDIKPVCRQAGEVLRKRRINSALVLIGPEGDFTQSEIDLAKQKGCIPVSLGNSTLKVDTAAIISVGLLTLSPKGRACLSPA